MVEESDLADRLEKILHQSNLENIQLFQTINSLLHRSVEYGRANRALGDNPTDEECREYIDKIISFYPKHQAVVACLERRDPEVWSETITKIRVWANGYLKNQTIDGPLRTKIVEECVPNAVMAYLSSAYYFDTEFDAWFCVLVQNVCRKYIKEQMHHNNQFQNEALSIDEVDYLLEQLADNKELNSREMKELRGELLETIKKLSSESRQELIILYYFEGFSFKEIAGKMGKSLNAIYKLHFDSLKELREISKNSTKYL